MLPAGVVPLPDQAGCSNFTATPLQHRPVVFWFFSYEPQPFFSVVQCTPQVSVSNVKVAVDLPSNTTTVVTINETTTSTIGSLGYLPYNGLFFDDGTLDQIAMSRLQSVQEQLPSAVFQAAKARDPLLWDTFVYFGFTEITADIYVRVPIYICPDSSGLSCFPCRTRTSVSSPKVCTSSPVKSPSRSKWVHSASGCT